MKRNLMKRILALALAVLLVCAGTTVYAATNETGQNVETGVQGASGLTNVTPNDQTDALGTGAKVELAFSEKDEAIAYAYKVLNLNIIEIMPGSASGLSGNTPLGVDALGGNAGRTGKPKVDLDMSLEAFEKNYGSLYESFLRIMKWFDENNVSIGNAIGQTHPSYKGVYDELSSYDMRYYYEVGEGKTNQEALIDRHALNQNRTVRDLLTQLQSYRTLLEDLKSVPKIDEMGPDFLSILNDTDALLDGLYEKNNSADNAPGYLSSKILSSFLSKYFGDKSLPSSLDVGGLATNYARPAPVEAAVHPPVNETSDNASDSGGSGDENPGDENPGDENPGDENPGDENPGDDNPSV